MRAHMYWFFLAVNIEMDNYLNRNSNKNAHYIPEHNVQGKKLRNILMTHQINSGQRIPLAQSTNCFTRAWTSLRICCCSTQPDTISVESINISPSNSKIKCQCLRDAFTLNLSRKELLEGKYSVALREMLFIQRPGSEKKLLKFLVRAEQTVKTTKNQTKKEELQNWAQKSAALYANFKDGTSAQKEALRILKAIAAGCKVQTTTALGPAPRPKPENMSDSEFAERTKRYNATYANFSDQQKELYDKTWQAMTGRSATDQV